MLNFSSPVAPATTTPALNDDPREDFEERAAILEFDASLPRAEAERQAAGMTTSRAATPLPADRPHKLTPTELVRAHAQPWSDVTCARFAARVTRFLRLGFSGADADDLAERLHLRDVQIDDRHLCIECTHLAGHASAGWRCRSYRAAGVATDLPAGLVTTMHRCQAFADATS